jgi:hypothetical protein
MCKISETTAEVIMFSNISKREIIRGSEKYGILKLIATI